MAAQVLLPLRVDVVDRDDDPDGIVGLGGGTAEPQAHGLRGPVLLTGIARAARGHHVVPRVTPSPALGDDVIDVLGLAPAVLALEVVPYEDGPPG
jgi:hypothetical protein